MVWAVKQHEEIMLAKERSILHGADERADGLQGILLRGARDGNGKYPVDGSIVDGGSFQGENGETRYKRARVEAGQDY